MSLLSYFKNLWLSLLTFFYSNELDLAILGLHNAGKTSLVKVLSGQSFQEDTIPTVGCDLDYFRVENLIIKCYDLSGQTRFQSSIWQRYYLSRDLIIYVIDLSDQLTLKESKKVLHNVILETSISCTPILIIGNKIDLLTDDDFKNLCNYNNNTNYYKAKEKSNTKDHIKDKNNTNSNNKHNSNSPLIINKIELFANFLGIEFSNDKITLRRENEIVTTNTTNNETLNSIEHENNVTKPNNTNNNNNNNNNNQIAHIEEEEITELDRDVGIFIASVKNGDNLKDIINWIVPKSKRLLQISCAIFWCLLSGGPIFGFAALKPILVNEGVYSSLCSSHKDVQFESMFNIEDDFQADSKTRLCTERDLKLNMMFTVAAVLTNVSAAVIGSILDRFGPRVCGFIGAFFLFASCYIFINADKINNFDPYLFGYGAMALGGPFAYISSFQLSNAFPKKSGSVLAFITGAFDASSAIFLLYKIAYNKLDNSVTIQQFFKIYLCVPLFITFAQLFIMPHESYGIPVDPEHAPTVTNDAEQAILDENTSLLPTGSQEAAMRITSNRRDSLGEAMKTVYAEEVETAVEKTISPGNVFGILHGFSASYQFRTYWFFLMCAFAIIQMLRLNYFVATINTQYTYLLHSSEKAEMLNKIFDFALPLGGIISIPFVGLFLDNCSTVVVLSGLLLFSLIIGILGIIPNSMIAGIIHVLIFVAYRPFFYTSISDYCAKVFGFDTFGTIYGSIMCLSGIFNFLQSFLDKETHTTFKMNPIPLNAILVGITVIIGGITVWFVKVEAAAYNQKKEQLRHIDMESSTIRVANISESTTITDLYSIFIPFGPIKHIIYPNNDKFLSSIEIKYETVEDAKEAFENMNGFKYFNKNLVVRRINDETQAPNGNKKIQVFDENDASEAVEAAEAAAETERKA
ncbi:hypothetical protein PACTADRAFT_1447 [Pachysolen tannophilus NRRL Y-2460]|uniref:RRM domain-containing protein n=1 Tax=Pachysolen tannophilus NRRL Y-2460 TaxID=669874 RepID=A0A1E4TYQ2_PACTA|nr:hypothetical protein PACTADRAFT_1447 [Pachysolen tannophilus NRRL Y-2460]